AGTTVGASSASSDGVTIAADALDADGHRIGLDYIGRSPVLRQQSQPLLFKIQEAHKPLAIGAAVKVIARGGGAHDGIVLPATAIVRAPNGMAQVWTKLSPERFKPTPVRTAPLDARRVEITAGLEPGQRIVVEGAELINQIR
ncbi:MAG: hypothetical protein ACRCS9_01930, partial [Hyphomicrobium sp.]